MKSAIFLTLASAATVFAAPAPLHLIARAPPNVPSASEARTQLAGLTVAAQGPQDGYSRDLFPHWITQSGTCNTRETVLKRDGTNVVTNSACASTSGSWFSPYDGVTWSAASDVDIDHLVPLSNAWKVHSLQNTHYFKVLELTHHTVWSCRMDNCTPSSLCQRLDKPATTGCHRQRQPSKGRQGTRGVEAPASQLLLCVLAHVGQGEERVCFDYYKCGEDCVDEHVGDVLSGKGWVWVNYIEYIKLQFSCVRLTLCSLFVVRSCLRLVSMAYIAAMEIRFTVTSCIQGSIPES
jgi:hypothetical protein